MQTAARAGAVMAAAAGLCSVAAQPAPAQPPDTAASTPVASPQAAATSPISARRLESRLSGLMRGAGGGSGAWVYDVGADRAVFGFNANRRRILASNTKLFTTAAALDRLGANRRLETSVWAPGFPAPEEPPPENETEPPVEQAGSASDGALDGSLYLVGDGDPALGSRSFAKLHNLPVTPLKELAKEVRRAGIRRVKGKLRVDASVFDRKRGTGVSGWSRYIGPLAGLTYNSGRGSRDPAIAAGLAFRKALRKAGVRVRGVARGTAPAEFRERAPVATVRSPELARLVDETNETSNNFFAEMLLKRLDASEGEGGTTRGGARRVQRFAGELGSRVRSRDGSGLSRANRASPKQVGKLLAGMLEHDAKGAYRSSLPVAGREGTVRARMRGSAAEGRCRAKTGTLTGVSALSGYCDSGKRTIVFSILMNGTDVYSARRIQDRVVAAVARRGL